MWEEQGGDGVFSGQRLLVRPLVESSGNVAHRKYVNSCMAEQVVHVIKKQE